MKLILAAIGTLLLSAIAGAQELQSKPDVDKRFEKHVFTKEGASLPYRLLKPDGYDKDGKERYPLVIFLHGIGGRGTDNQTQIRSGVAEFAKEATRKKHPCFLAVPQCPPDKTWSDISRGARVTPTFAAKPTEPAALVLELIDGLCKEYRIDTDRNYLTGLSMGGYGTWDLACRKPERFAAALVVCGGGDPAQASNLAKLPIWVVHNDADPLVPVERSREMIAALKKAGGKPEYTEYKAAGHDAWTATYKNEEVLDWLFKQKKGSDR